jgi:large subunit ribosomal protein L21
MYAVIRAGGKQYRVAPGDVIRLESMPAESGKVEFNDVLAVSGEAGKISRPDPAAGARVVGSVVEQGRSAKVLVFHYKRKKQYKKLQGHRQAYTAVRITEIAFDGQSFKAADEVPKKEKPPKQAKSQTKSVQPQEEAEQSAPAKAAKSGAAKKVAAKKTGGAKGTKGKNKK